MMYKEKTRPESSKSADKLRKIERMEKERTGDHDLTIAPPIFNLMADLVDKGELPMRVFHWLKGVSEIKQQKSGSIVIDCNEVTARHIFQFLGESLSAHFKTRKMATRFYDPFGVERVAYFEPPKEREERIMSPRLKGVLDQVLGRAY